MGSINHARTTSVEWCLIHSSNGRGPSPNGDRCHYAALCLATNMGIDNLRPCTWEQATVTSADLLAVREAF